MRLYIKKLPEESSGTIQFLLKNLSRQTDNEGGGFEWKMNLKSLWDNYPRILDNIEAHKPFQKPTLFIRGGASNYIQNTDFSHINQLFPHATIETVDDAGHWIHADKPVELLHLLTNFL